MLQCFQVHGKPSIPEGLLEVRDLRKDGCRLQWEASNRKLKDDPVYMAEKAQMQEELTKEFATDLDPDMND